MRYFIVTIFAMTIFVFAATAQATGNKAAMLQDLIKAKNATIETLLNDKARKIEAAQFLHDHISNDATFTLSVNNPALADKKQSFEMNKADYINTYIQGTNFVDNYAVHINTVKMQAADSAEKAYSVEIMTERGTMIDPATAEKGRDFVSTTTCRTLNSLSDDNTVISEGSECHTEISFEESV